MKYFFLELIRNLKTQCIGCEEDPNEKYQKVLLPLNTLFNHIPVVQDNAI